MTYPFPSDIASRIQSQLVSGRFETEDDVLREAMDALEKRQRGLEQIRSDVEVADRDIAAGRIGTFDAEASKLAVRQRLAENRVTR